MRLISLGGLRLDGVKFRREKPLLLLAYLCLEGPKPRRFLAELFWPEKDAPLTNLGVALDHLRKLGAAQGDNTHLWAERATCDAVELRDHLKADRIQAALNTYPGAFVDSLNLEDIGEELEEWVVSTRETLGQELRAALLRHAEEAAQQSHFLQAGQLTESAYRLPGCAPLEPEELPRYYRLLRAADHPLRKTIEREAAEYGLTLDAPAEQARQTLKPHFIGRQGELERLTKLQPGQWAWVGGASGIGKTALLRELAARQNWRYLPARRGLPYATLEPLLGDLAENETVLLRRLLTHTPEHTSGLVLDSWENIDPESQQLLLRLHGLQPNYPVILAGLNPPPMPTDQTCELSAMTAGELLDYPQVYQATGGVPALVGAYLRGEPLVQALSARLARLNEMERQVYAALALLPTPDLTLVRQALNLNGPELVATYEHLMACGLVEPSCEVRGPEVAARHLEGEPVLTQHLSLRLARLLPIDTALPLYQRAKPAWESGDLHRVEQAYLSWAGELLRRGFPRKAAELLQDGPASSDMHLLRARALERSNQFKPALNILNELPHTQDTQALKSRVLFKLGHPNQAQQAAQAALNAGTSLEAQAEALNTLGEISLRKGELLEAIALFSRSATLWQAAGQKSRWLWALNNRASARMLLGENIETVFQEVLDAAGDDDSVRAMVLNNMGNGYAHSRNAQRAEEAYRQAITLGIQTGGLGAVALAWNGLGVLFHAEQPEQARTAYEQGLRVCEQTQDAQLTAIMLANLAELNGDIPAWEQAIELLEQSGFHSTAQDLRVQLESFGQR